jgi:uncharacterized protein
MILPVTLTAAGIAALINLWLAVRCGQARGSEKVSIGDGGNDLVIRRMRAHANFIEYTPIVVILIAVVELAQGTSMWLWARVAHGLGMDGLKGGRSAGTIVTMLTMVGLGLYAIAIPHMSGGQVETVDTEAVPSN